MAAQARKSTTKLALKPGTPAVRARENAAGAVVRKPRHPAQPAVKQAARKRPAGAAGAKPATSRPSAVAKKTARKPAKTQPVAAKHAPSKPVGTQRAAVKTPVATRAAGKSPPKPVAAKTASQPAAKVVHTAGPAATQTSTPRPGRGAAQQPARATRKPRRRITPAQALANTRALLEAKQAHDRQPPPWQSLDTQAGPVPQPGFQSDAARLRADELHAGESRLPAIQGSISTQDRHQQGKRDDR